MPAARLPRWANRYPPRGFAPRSARRYTKPRGSPLLATGTTSAVPLRGVNFARRLGVSIESRLTGTPSRPAWIRHTTRRIANNVAADTLWKWLMRFQSGAVSIIPPTVAPTAIEEPPDRTLAPGCRSPLISPLPFISTDYTYIEAGTCHLRSLPCPP